jgi:uncharacterized membrane protein YphA (DoxX/SURF4 family)
MKITVVIARILLGLMFTVFGLNGFLHFIPAGMPGGEAGAFIGAMAASHYAYFVFGVQLAAGLLLLIDRFVPLALALLAAVIANILAFHITMAPSGLPMAILAAVLWVIVALPFRPQFAPFLAQKARPN